jgi:hypothetical protein
MSPHAENAARGFVVALKVVHVEPKTPRDGLSRGLLGW